MYWSFTGVGESAELIQVLSRDILSVHWARAATHFDGVALEKGFSTSSSAFEFSRNVGTTPCTVRC